MSMQMTAYRQKWQKIVDSTITVLDCTVDRAQLNAPTESFNEALVLELGSEATRINIHWLLLISKDTG